MDVTDLQACLDALVAGPSDGLGAGLDRLMDDLFGGEHHTEGDDVVRERPEIVDQVEAAVAQAKEAKRIAEEVEREALRVAQEQAQRSQ